MTKFAFIGDIHSQLAPMRKAVDYCISNSLLPIFLGDMFDSRCSTSDTVAVYHFARECQERLGAIILDSNHQEKLYRYLLNGKVRIDLVPELGRSVEEFRDAGVPVEELMEWLQQCPLGVVIRDDDGKEFRAAHAYFPSFIEVPDFTDFFLLREGGRKVRELCRYGPKREDGGRRLWWENPTERAWIRVCGHYHVVFRDERSLALDAGCGGTRRSWFCNGEPALALYDGVSRQIVEFT